MGALPSREEEAVLYRRLVERDPTAPSDLAERYFEPLFPCLRANNDPHVADDLLQEAAGDALLPLMKHPEKFDPNKKSLWGFLRMAAQGDSKNLLARERRRHRKQSSLDDVQLSSAAGKYLQI